MEDRIKDDLVGNWVNEFEPNDELYFGPDGKMKFLYKQKVTSASNYTVSRGVWR